MNNGSIIKTESADPGEKQFEGIVVIPEVGAGE